jgi:hypothetical protein
MPAAFDGAGPGATVAALIVEVHRFDLAADGQPGRVKLGESRSSTFARVHVEGGGVAAAGRRGSLTRADELDDLDLDNYRRSRARATVPLPLPDRSPGPVEDRRPPSSILPLASASKNGRAFAAAFPRWTLRGEVPKAAAASSAARRGGKPSAPIGAEGLAFPRCSSAVLLLPLLRLHRGRVARGGQAGGRGRRTGPRLGCRLQSPGSTARRPSP